MNHKPGFRFKPTDEELIIDFLIPMVFGLISEVDVPIAEVEFLKHEPWDLPEFSKIKSNDPYWYFFYKLDTGKYLNSKRADRTTKGGYWKATGSDREVRSRDTKQLIGSKKTLVFHEGRVSKKVMGQGINWVIHEYHLTPNIPNPDAYVICCLKKEAKKKTIGKAKKKANGEASTSIPVEDQSPSDFVKPVAENIIFEGEGASLVDTPSQAHLETVMYAQQGPFYQDRPLCSSYNSDTLSQAELEEAAYLELLSQLNHQQGPSSQDLPYSNAFNSDPLSQLDLAAVYQKPPLFNSFSNRVPTQFVTINGCETYPVEAINWGAVTMSSAQPLQSISGISYCEDGGISSDTNNEKAIAQARVAIQHVIAANLQPQLSHNSTQHVTVTHLSPQLSHNSTQDITTTYLSPKLSHNSTQHVTATHLSPQLSHNSNACMGMYFEDFNEFVS